MNIAILTVDPESYASRRLREEGRDLGHETVSIAWQDIRVTTDDGRGLRIATRDHDFASFDIIIPRSSKGASSVTSPITNSHRHIFNLLPSFCAHRDIFLLNGIYFSSNRLRGKLAEQAFLAENGFPGIPTVTLTRDVEAHEIPFPYPVVVKTNFGSRGQGVHRAKSLEQVRELTRKYDALHEHCIAQTYLPTQSDFRILTLGTKTIGAIERIPRGNEWRTNLSLGGSAIAVNDDRLQSLSNLTSRIASSLSIDYAGIDILEYMGRLFIIEINDLPQFEGFERALPDINVARSLIRFAARKRVDIRKK